MTRAQDAMLSRSLSPRLLVLQLLLVLVFRNLFGASPTLSFSLALPSALFLSLSLCCQRRRFVWFIFVLETFVNAAALFLFH